MECVAFIVIYLKGNNIKLLIHTTVQNTNKNLYKFADSQTLLHHFYNLNCMIHNSKRQRKEFRVKFTGNERLKSSTSKSMILGTRQRSARSFATKEVEQGIEEDQIEMDSNTSKRELQTNKTNTAIQVEYANINTSNIVNSFDTIHSFFDEAVSFKLIFRASNHKFSVKDFHQICDAYEHTLTICQTEDNKIIGGYTPLTWQDQFHRNSTHFKTDFKRETFIFSVTDKAKYPLVKSLKNKAICCFKSYGPTFGGGYDLLIGDRSNELPNTTSYFPRNFEHPNGANFNKRDFTGTSRKNFKVIEWQVYHVIKLQQLKTIENLNFTQMTTGLENKNKISIWQRLRVVARQIINALCSDS